MQKKNCVLCISIGIIVKFTLKGVDYEVLEHTKDKYRVLMLNRKAISK